MEKANKLQKRKNGRLYSLDILRGIVVILSVFLSNIPRGEYEFHYLEHATWYGVTIIDIILPSFITIFGISMAIAYQKGVTWNKILRRTVRLIVYGVIFTIIVSWSIDFSTIRLTGVLQMFAFLGVITVLITKIVKSPTKLILIAFFISTLYGGFLLTTSAECEGGIPQPNCNPSGTIDSKIFGESHIYQEGERGYDPEGFVTSLSALSNVLFGYAFGRLLLNRTKVSLAWKQLLLIGVILIGLSLIWNQLLPYNKRMWTPAFSLLASGSTSILLVILYLTFDYRKKVDAKSTALKPVIWFFEAFGRNSFLVYFGKFIISSVLIHITITVHQEKVSLYTILLNWVEEISKYPQITYASLMLLFWIVTATVLHKKKLYLKV